jgi:RNA polymerase sigma factor for flagellar operon FliA
VRKWEEYITDRAAIRLRDELVELYTPLIDIAARRAIQARVVWMNPDIATSYAGSALVEAVTTFVGDISVFPTYALNLMRHRICDGVRDEADLTRGEMAEYQKCAATTADLTQQLQRPPTLAELADATGLSPSRVMVISKYPTKTALHLISHLYHNVDIPGIDKLNIPVNVSPIEQADAVQDLLTTCSTPQRVAIMLRFVYDFDPEQIGGILGVTPARVWQLIREGQNAAKQHHLEREPAAAP